MRKTSIAWRVQDSAQSTRAVYRAIRPSSPGSAAPRFVNTRRTMRCPGDTSARAAARLRARLARPDSPDAFPLSIQRDAARARCGHNEHRRAGNTNRPSPTAAPDRATAAPRGTDGSTLKTEAFHFSHCVQDRSPRDPGRLSTAHPRRQPDAHRLALSDARRPRASPGSARSRAPRACGEPSLRRRGSQRPFRPLHPAGRAVVVPRLHPRDRAPRTARRRYDRRVSGALQLIHSVPSGFRHRVAQVRPLLIQPPLEIGGAGHGKSGGELAATSGKRLLPLLVAHRRRTSSASQRSAFRSIPTYPSPCATIALSPST